MHGRVDSLINSAGGQFPQPAIDFSVKGWNAVINTNLNGTWYMMQAAAQRWRDNKYPGSIVNIVVVTTHGLYGIAHTIAARSGAGRRLWNRKAKRSGRPGRSAQAVIGCRVFGVEGQPPHPSGTGGDGEGYLGGRDDRRDMSPGRGYSGGS